MIDIYLYGDISDKVYKICKQKYRSDYKSKHKEIMKIRFSEIINWLEDEKKSN